MKVEHPEQTDSPKQYTLADVLTYPFSISGIIHLVIFFAVGILVRPAFTWAYWMSPPIMHLAMLVLMCGYCLYYLASCIRTSAAGELRAPDVNMQPEQLSTDAILSRLFATAAWAVFCLAPMFAYLTMTRRMDWLFWLLVAYAVVYSPMAFLAIVLFDSVRALNPLLIIPSIANVFVPYLLLLLGWCFVCAAIAFAYRWSPIVGSVCTPLLMMTAHVLGRFYMSYQNRLNWEA